MSAKHKRLRRAMRTFDGPELERLAPTEKAMHRAARIIVAKAKRRGREASLIPKQDLLTTAAANAGGLESNDG